MTKKEYNDRINKIKEELISKNEFDASILFAELTSDLYDEKAYSLIIEAYNKIYSLVKNPSLLYNFDLIVTA